MNDNYKFPMLGSTMLPSQVRGIDDYIFSILADSTRNKLFEYITQYDELTTPMYDTFGFEISRDISIPDELVNPRNFNVEMYPLLDDKSMFATVRPYDYLATFNVSSLSAYNDDEDLRIKAAHELLAAQSQSRFTNIWREMGAVLFALDSIRRDRSTIIRGYLNKLIARYKQFPFYEARERINFEITDIASCIPTLIYMLMSVGCDIIYGNINEADAKQIIDFYLLMAKDSYCDTKLKFKSTIRSWLTEGISKLGTVKVIKWSQDCEILGVFHKKVTEHPEVLEIAIKERMAKFSLLPSQIQEFITTRVQLIKNISDVEKLFRITQSMSNDRTYFKTLVELSLDAAVQPKLRETFVKAPKVLAVDSSGNPVDFSFRGVDDGLIKCENYLRDAAQVVAERISNLNFEKEWLNFITTSSAGKKLTDEELVHFSSNLGKRLHNVRLIRVALESEKYFTRSFIDESIKDPTVLVVRQQIDRRQRTIAGLSNPKLFASFPSYRIGKEYYKLSPSVAQGKQIGNMFDVKDLLHCTTLASGLCSSVDISGMDASIQPTLRRVFDILTISAAKKITHGSYGPWRDKLEHLIDTSLEGNNESRYITLPSVLRALVFQSSTLQTATIYRSKLFSNNIVNREGTFESGRADTSTHHTVLLDSCMHASGQLMREAGKPFTRILNKEMGDDVFAAYEGNEQDNIDNAKADADFLSTVGFKTTLEISRNHGIFLQQQVVLGRIFGLSNRVSLFTREHVKAIKSLKSACNELMSLCDDISSRIVNPEGLRILIWSVALFCISRHTLELDKKYYSKIVERLKNVTNVQEYETKETVPTRLLTVYMPFMWFMLYGGGEMFGPGLMRDDGSFTMPDFITTPTGPYRRRYLIDLVGVTEVVSKKFIYSRTLVEYNIVKAQYLIDLNLDGLEKQARLSDEDMIDAQNLATHLDSIGDTKRLDKSLIAYNRLLDEGIRLPHSIVAGYDNYTKIEQIITSGEFETLRSDVLSLILYENLLRLGDITKYKMKLFKEDVYHLYEIVETDLDVNIRDHAAVTDEIPFLFSMHSRNAVWKLHAILGGPNVFTSEFRKELASVRGKFAHFKYTDPVFVEAFKIYMRNKSLLPLFYQAVGMDGRSQLLFDEALEYFSQNGNYQYEYIINPRKIFFLTDDVTVVKDNVLIMIDDLGYINPGRSVVNSRLYNSLIMTFAYTYLLSKIENFSMKRFAIKLSRPLINRLSWGGEKPP